MTLLLPQAAEPPPLPTLALPLLRLRVTLRLLAATTLPAAKGPMLRGGFGYAFQQASCPKTCWGQAEECTGPPCPFRRLFATERPHGVTHLHDLHDPPRPFVVAPPADQRTRFGAGEALEFGLTLIGQGVDHLPYFVFGFEQLGRLGLGRDHAPARLERVEALAPWQPTGQVVYQDGRVLATDAPLPLLDWPQIAARAATLPPDLRLVISTPLRIKAGGSFLHTLDVPALVQAVCWRLNALATFHGGGPWPVHYHDLAAQAAAVTVRAAQIRWEDQERTSRRGTQPQRMQLGGIVGSAVLRDVPLAVRAVLLAGSVVGVGKACVFGQGGYEVRGE